ncbi:F0F1 ATP synthase subunit C [Spiroplasma helicoides]|uniref:ATP synthase subunit c n=1 Tax=Spiroplasma helicoides TaxID=216938 RepID=A0A1B3SJB4_9MOLU|nr:hypothetical protein [Spiroplasma helicoides]AOG60018.1 F0F1 ATP synthase subunit C [Spiroplasma helicoides]
MFAQLFTVASQFSEAWISILPAIMFESTITGDLQKGLYGVGAGLTGIGMIGASVGQGVVGHGACLAIGRNPEVAGKITSTLIITAGISESGAIYALVIAMLILFVL